MSDLRRFEFHVREFRPIAPPLSHINKGIHSIDRIPFGLAHFLLTRDGRNSPLYRFEFHARQVSPAYSQAPLSRMNEGIYSAESPPHPLSIFTSLISSDS